MNPTRSNIITLISKREAGDTWSPAGMKIQEHLNGRSPGVESRLKTEGSPIKAPPSLRKLEKRRVESKFSLKQLPTNQEPLRERRREGGGATACTGEEQQRTEGTEDSAHHHVLALPPIGSLELLSTVHPGRGGIRLVNLLHTS